MLSQPFLGARCLLRGFGLIRRPGIRRYVFVPLAVNALLFGLGLWYLTRVFSTALAALLPGWLAWLEWLLWPLFALSVLLVVFYGFSLAANVLAAPFNGLLSEAVERHLTGAGPGSGTTWGALIARAVPTMLQELGKLIYFVLWAVPVLGLFLVPGVNVAAPLLWLAFSAWMLALEYVDYPAGNHDQGFFAMRRLLRRRRLVALGFGASAMLLTVVPVINFLVMPVAVAGATAMWLDHYAGDASAAADKRHD